MITFTNDTQKAFDTLQTNLPAQWLAPKIKYTRWTKNRSYWSPTFSDLKIEENQLKTVVDALTLRKKTPEANNIINLVETSYLNEFVNVLKNALQDKAKKREHQAAKVLAKQAKADRKERAKTLAAEKKATAKITADKERARLKAIRQEKAAIAKAKAKKTADRKKVIAKKNATLMKALYLTPQQKAILKQIAG